MTVQFDVSGRVLLDDGGERVVARWDARDEQVRLTQITRTPQGWTSFGTDQPRVMAAAEALLGPTAGPVTLTLGADHDRLVTTRAETCIVWHPTDFWETHQQGGPVDPTGPPTTSR
ncbi:hypothetical protein [Nakamurella endophytica]|uniref:hypothetical protein n=1 Tax=Nakamurella endophytica TaxID=1748367 RepID=UPI00166A823C|nr:hypothetical protein [Nakamurella endophytica]